MAKAKRQATKKPAAKKLAVHLGWFDDAPKPRGSRRAPKTEKRPRPPRARVRPLADALPKVIRPHPKLARPAPAPGLKSGVARALIDRSRIRTPRRLVLPSRTTVPRRTLASWFATR
jgi:hypothetical protein